MTSDGKTQPIRISPGSSGESGSTAHRSLQEIQRRVDKTLGGMPKLRLEARKHIASQLGIDPSAELTQIMEKLAHDPVGQGSIRLLSRSILSLRLLTDQEMEPIFTDGAMDSGRLARAAGLLPGLVQISSKFGDEMNGRIASLDGKEKEFLEQIGNFLQPSRDTLVTAAILAPRLEVFARRPGGEDLKVLVPSLDDRDLRWLDKQLGKGKDIPCSGIHALALRTVIHEDLEAFRRAREQADSPSTGKWQAFLAPLERDGIAYRKVSEAVQARQNRALMDGQKDLADDLNRVKQPLFSIYLKLGAVLRNPHAELESGPAVDMAGVRKAVAEGEARAKALKEEKRATDDLFLTALKKDKKSAVAPPPDVVVS